MSVVTYTALSSFLQGNWALPNPATSQIDWLTYRSDIAVWLTNSNSNKVMVACLCGRPSDKHRISQSAFKINDYVEVKVYVKGQGSASANAILRDTVYGAIETLVLTNPSGITGVNITDPQSNNSLETSVLATESAVLVCRYLEGT